MGEVKRYELQGDGALLWRDDGEYVLHSDYATLEAERDALRAAQANMIDATGAVESHCYICAHEKYPDGPSVVRCRVPDDWAGSRVLIVRVAK